MKVLKQIYMYSRIKIYKTDIKNLKMINKKILLLFMKIQILQHLKNYKINKLKSNYSTKMVKLEYE